MAKRLTIEFYRDSTNQTRFRMKGRNGEIVSNSEDYKNKSDAAATVLMICEAIKSDDCEIIDNTGLEGDR